MATTRAAGRRTGFSLSPLRRILRILTAALLLRLFFVSRAGASLDALLTRAGQAPAFAAAALGFETGRFSAAPPDLLTLLAEPSALLSVRALSYQATPAGVDALPVVLPETPAPAAPTAAPTPGRHTAPETTPADTPKITPTGPTAPETPAGPAPETAHIREITLRPAGTEGYDTAQGVYVKNESGLSVDMEALLAQTPSLPLVRGKPQVLIVHTHGSEAYCPDPQNLYTPSDVERTEDRRYNVVRVGDEIAGALTARGLSVLHDREIYDFPSYTGSYGRSLEAVTKAKTEHPSLLVILDVHRDSIVTSDDVTCKTVVTVAGEKMAQLMLVVGTDGAGLTHPNWKQNLSLAAHLQKAADAHAPGLMRPINLRRERFNQHAAPGALLLEVGASGNTLPEALAAARQFAAVLGDYLTEQLP
ncbi:MAG: stage II sporulation protein P [Oscillospiraceae bacterium]|jgi:stage II sporulation protein P|nr:stage II sporulation protein P [Oscillospiraceae bacterium]